MPAMPSSQPTSPRPNSPRLLEVTMPDNSTSQVRIFEPKYHRAHNDYYKGDGIAPDTHDGVAIQSSSRMSGSTTGGSTKPLVVIWPGFGMGARYFDPMGRELATRGFLVASGELRGQGTSTAKATRAHTWGYHHLASQDYPVTIKSVKEDLGLAVDHPTVFLCHSLSGQIAPLFFTRDEAAELNVQGFFGVGAGSPTILAILAPSDANFASVPSSSKPSCRRLVTNQQEPWISLVTDVKQSTSCWNGENIPTPTTSVICLARIETTKMPSTISRFQLCSLASTTTQIAHEAPPKILLPVCPTRISASRNTLNNSATIGGHANQKLLLTASKNLSVNYSQLKLTPPALSPEPRLRQALLPPP